MLTALVTRQLTQLVSHAVQVTFYRQPPPALVARLLLPIVSSAALLLLAFNVLVATIYRIQSLVFFALP